MARPPQDKNRHEKLLKLAIQIMAKEGLVALSFQKMADRAHVSQSTVMHYFPSKAELLSEISIYVANLNRGYVESFDKITDGADVRLLNFLLHNFSWARMNPEMAQVIVMFSFLAISDEEFKALYQKRLVSVREKIQAILFAGLRESVFDFEPSDSENLAAIFHNFVVAAITNFLATGSKTEEKSYNRKARLLMNSLLGIDS